jgi:hypothetical protein
MQDPLRMRVLHRSRHFRHQCDCSPRFTAQRWGRIQQAAPTGKLHAKKWQPIVAFAYFINWQNVRMIEARCSLRFTPESCQRFLRIGVIRQDSFQRDDAARMPLPRPINYPHPTAPDFFQNLIISYTPIGVTYIEFPEHVIKRFRFRWTYGRRVVFLPIRTDSCGKQAAKTKTSSNP